MMSDFLAPKPHCKNLSVVTLFVMLSSTNVNWTLVASINMASVWLMRNTVWPSYIGLLWQCVFMCECVKKGTE